MVEVSAMKQFHHLLVTLSKLAKLAVLRLTKNKVAFILCDTGGVASAAAGGGPAVWAQADRETFFQEYHMEGVTKDEDEIYLEFEPDLMAKTLGALKTSTNARSCKIKLARKRDAPCLTFELELAATPSMTSMVNTASSFSSSRLCVHDVPVSLIPRRLWPDFAEPDLTRGFDVSLYLPDLKQLKTLTERYKNLGHHFTIEANRAGTLKLVLEADLVNVVTHFKDLEAPRYEDKLNASMFQGAAVKKKGRNKRRRTDSGDGSDQEEEEEEELDDQEFVSVRVDLKKFHMFLAAEQIAPKKVIANLVRDKMIHMFLIHNDICIQYFIPGIHS
jgi:HUS1 checkpoint protein